MIWLDSQYRLHDSIRFLEYFWTNILVQKNDDLFVRIHQIALNIEAKCTTGILKINKVINSLNKQRILTRGKWSTET